MPDHMKAVSRIAKLRNEIGLSQAQLAVLIGVTTNTIQNWERGKSGVEQIVRFLKLCEILGCELEDLIEYVPSSDADKPKVGNFSLRDMRQLRQRWNTEEKALIRNIENDEETKVDPTSKLRPSLADMQQRIHVKRIPSEGEESWQNSDLP